MNSHFLRAFFSAYFVMVTIDSLWIFFIARRFYSSHVGSLLRSTASWHHIVSGLLVWGLLLLGLMVFVLPYVQHASMLKTFLYGALFGCIVYGVYDCTNYATLEGWTIPVSVVDVLWGSFINGLMLVIIRYLIIR